MILFTFAVLGGVEGACSSACSSIQKDMAEDITTGHLCEAKRILSQVPDGGVPDLAKVRRLIAAAKAKQLAAERPDFERNILCVDGDISGCACQAASHQGSCCHHHGIAGCEPYPKEVDCP